ncbi:MAG: hypothetical protein WAW46_10060 [Polaromonas sp.]
MATVSEPLLQAAHEALGIPLRYAQAGSSLARAAMAGAQRCIELAHYPRQDVVDMKHGTRFYYHAHGSRRRPGNEHGHFHLFAQSSQPGDYTHLAGISLDAQGQPIRFFTTNRWVTGETWRQAADIERALAHFAVLTSGRMAPVARWLTALVHLYAPQLVRLVRRRDAVMARRAASQGWEALCEDRRLDVVTECRISLSQRIQQLGC